MVIRRVPADNSCLFHAVGYLLEGRRANYCDSHRKIVQDAIMRGGGKYTSSVLGCSPDAYIANLLDRNSWGGE